MSYSQYSSPESGSSTGSSIHPHVNPQRNNFSQGGSMHMQQESSRPSTYVSMDRTADVDYYFVKKLTLALEQLSMSREGRVDYGSPVVESNLSKNVGKNGGSRRLKVPLLTLANTITN